MIEHETTGQKIARSLITNGVDTVFGIPGAHMYDFNDALYEYRNKLRFIHTRHEQGAGYMAYGYAKSSGRAGVYTVVPGPGVLNSGAALCTAYGANAPVFCITGNIMADLIGRGRGQLHELPDQLATLRGLTKAAERIEHPSSTYNVMANLFTQMSSGRQRPVAVEARGTSLARRDWLLLPGWSAACSAAGRSRQHRSGRQTDTNGEESAHHGRRRCYRRGS